MVNDKRSKFSTFGEVAPLPENKASKHCSLAPLTSSWRRDGARPELCNLPSGGEWMDGHEGLFPFMWRSGAFSGASFSKGLCGIEVDVAL